MHARNPAAPISAVASQSDITTTTSTVAADKKPFLLRHDISPLAKERFGLPLGYSTLVKECAEGRGPTPAFQYGQRFLYEEAEVIRWLLARCKPVPDKATQPADPPAEATDTGSPRPRRGRPPKPKPEIASTTSVVG
jgi:hypothetical protein